MRLIDSYSAKEALEYTLVGDAASMAERVIDSQPTVDAVSVVRCRECKHLNVVNRKELYAFCPKTNFVFLPFQADTRTHFCSYGEPKET